jgi:hypothetical protein
MNSPETTSATKHWAPYAAIFVALILSLGLGFALWLRSLDFQAYQPMALPSGIAITGHDISIVKQGGDPNGTYFKTVGYKVNNPDISIGEQKSSAANYAGRLFSCKQSLLGSNCGTFTSPQHQTYSIQTSFSGGSSDTPGKAFSQTISWLRGDTLIWISLSGKQAGRHDDQTWAKVIDSFVPVNYGYEFTKIQSPLDSTARG